MSNGLRLFFLLLLLPSFCLAMETRGLLKSNESDMAIVGEVSRYTLTLVPFEEQLLKKEDLEGKVFLENLYVSEVLSIKQSENNYDAVDVILDIVPIQKFDVGKFYIWSLGARNIPVDLSLKEVKDVTLAQKNFSLLKTPSIDFLTKMEYLYGLVALFLAGLIIWLMYRFSKRSKKKNESIYKKAFLTASKREDLEALYFHKSQILDAVKEDALKNNLKLFFQKYSHNQFSPTWKDTDVSQLITEARDLGKEFERGV